METMWEWPLGDDSLLSTCLVDQSVLRQAGDLGREHAQHA